jgi:DNA-directed RNA polymerase subunit M/transcription elongation factor TFIIS
MGFPLRSNSLSRLGDSVTSRDFDVPADETETLDTQINVPPSGHHRLWKVIAAALRCPACGSTHHKAQTGKRQNADGLLEQYRHCESCGVRFRAVFE